MKQQSGFTLIELIAVIVILGILAATAIPKYVDLRASARHAALQGVAGGLGSASALNHANNIARDSGLNTTTTGLTINLCETNASLLDTGILPTGMEIVAGTGSAIVAGNGIGVEYGSSTCTVRYTGTTTPTATFVGYGVIW